ncbi:MAG: RAMP superfamily CRISPR-associated protein [Gammaproteobacteria bacterium SHHR-1]
MGTDADYDPTGYVIDDGVLYEFDALAALSVLSEAKRRQLDSILAGRANQDMLLKVQAFFYAHKDDLKAVARNQVQVSPMMEAFYQERVGHVSQHETGGKKVQNQLEIQRTAWNPVVQQAILPGSGLKGAVRTALLNKVNDGEPLKKVEDRKTGRQRDETSQQLQNRLFVFKPGKFELDPFRLLRFGDASLMQPDAFATQVRFALNRKKSAVTDASGNLRQSRAEQAGLYQLLECLPGLMPRAFSASLEIQSASNMPQGKWPSQQFDLIQIAAACNVFYGNRFNQEMALLRQRGYLDQDWDRKIKALLSAPWLNQAMRQGRAFLLRVGRHSGAESVTLEGVRNIKILRGRGENPAYLDQAKTLWLAGDERMLQTQMQPFGWVLVEAHRAGESLPGWPDDCINSSIRDWQQQIQQRQQRAAKQIQDRLEAERQTRLEAERQAAEQAAREQAAAEQAQRQQAEFNALPDSAKALIRLRQEVAALMPAAGQLDKDRYANLVGLLSKAAEQAQTWPEQDARSQLALFLEQIFDQVGWYPAGLDKKKRQRQEQKKRDQIAALRQGMAS